MILRAMALGFLLWLAGAAAFRFAGERFFILNELMWPFIAVAPLMAAVTWIGLKLLRVSPGDEAEGAIGLAAPGLLLNVYAVSHFAALFPNLDPLLAADYGALLMLAYGAAIVTGVLMTRLSPSDERVAALPGGADAPGPQA